MCNVVEPRPELCGNTNNHTAQQVFTYLAYIAFKSAEYNKVEPLSKRP